MWLFGTNSGYYSGFGSFLPCRRGPLGRLPHPLVLATEHLLLGRAAAEGETATWLRQQGLDPDALQAEIHQLYGYSNGGAAAGYGRTGRVAAGTGRRPVGKQAEIDLLRILDAAANRAREGLRVVEDYVRFALDDRHLTERRKRLRHDLAAVLGRLPTGDRLAARETQADVGITLTTPFRATPRRCRRGRWPANFSRLQESLRTLEEFGKLLDADMAAGIEQLRYRAYTLQRAVEFTRAGLERLAAARLYVLLDGGPSTAELERLARGADRGGRRRAPTPRQADSTTGGLWSGRGCCGKLTAGTATLLIVNDRPDVAAWPAPTASTSAKRTSRSRTPGRSSGPRPWSVFPTHSIEQARQAVLDGANYLGVGPTFPSGTKQFEDFPGVALLRAVAAEIRLPAFAIGGIAPGNLAEVLSTGIGRVAVGGAITTAGDPTAVAREMSARLKS